GPLPQLPYCSRLKTCWGIWLAWAIMALPACCRICERDRLAVSAAKSASMIRLRAAVWFSTDTCRLEITESKRFWMAPKSARLALISLIALSMAVMDEPMAVESPVRAMPAAMAAATEVPALMSWPPTSMMSLAVTLAPIWKVCVAAEVRMAVPLKVVPLMTRSISLCSARNSFCRDALSLLLFVALRACTASSRMRCRELPTWPRAPSAVCASEMPSVALRTATFMPRTWPFMRSAIARPAASSLAEFTRRPEDRRCMEVAKELCDVLVLRWAVSELRLVLMMEAILNSLGDDGTAAE